MPKRIFHRNFSLRTLKHWLSVSWPIFLLISFTLVLSFLNYQPGTTLTGWDNLHPEYNFSLNFKNAVFSVWQEKGVGFLAGMSFAADLPRILILGVLRSLGVGGSDIRYLWTFLALTIGPVSTFFLLHHIFLKPNFDPQTKRAASFLGALFYLLNLATVQYFFTSFETFIAFFAFFPLIILATTLYFERASLKHYLFLLVVLLISSPPFLIQTFFVVTSLCLAPIILSHLRHGGKKILIFSLTLLATQSYWLLPQIFFAFTHAKEVGLSHANLLSSSETYYRNLQFANWKDLALLKGFWFNILDPNGDNKFDYLFLVWRNHLSNPIITTIGFLSFILVITGIFYSLKKKLPFTKSFLTMFVICVFFLLGGVQIAGMNIPLLSEFFRSPFTKFSISLAFVYSVFFSVGAVFLLDIFSFLHSRLTYYLTLFTVSIALIIFTTPAFTGNLISPQMRVKIPTEYEQLFDYFKTQDPATRIANFPQYVLWGWNYYSWGYRGAGFLWYGIKQPILDRAFDVWEKTSERYYEEMSTALYSENQAEFEHLIDKYAINWLLIDRNIIAADSKQDLGLEKLQRFIDNSDKFTLEKNISDKILVYKTSIDKNVKNFLSVGARRDAPLHPFASLSLRPSPVVIPGSPPTEASALQHLRAGDPESIQIDSRVRGNDNQILTIPSYSDTEALVPVNLAYRKTATGLEVRLAPILPEISFGKQKITLTSQANIIDFPLITPASGLVIGINDQYFEVQLPDELTVQNTFYPLINIYLPPQKNINLTLFSNVPSNRFDLTSFFNQAQPYQCYTNKPDRKIEKVVDRQTISLFGTDLVGCLSVPLPAAATLQEPQADLPPPIDTLNQLLFLEFTYSSHTGTPGNASITDASLGGSSSPQPLQAKNEPSFTRIFARSRPVPLQANLILEANEIKTTQEIIYQNVQVSYLPQLGEANLTLNPIPNQQIKMSNEKRTTSNISISLPIVESSLTVRSTPESSNFLANVGNCDNFNQGKFNRETTNNGFLYTATSANACDQMNLKHLPHGINYALIANIQNEVGLFPTVCLENYSTRRCDVFERLVNGPQLIIQPISNPNEGAGYTLHLFNQSFGNRETKNLTRSITVSPLPLQFLKGITLDSSTSVGMTGNVIPSDHSVIPSAVEGSISSTHPAEFLYTAEITSDGDPAGSSSEVISLYQTKSPYWKALEVSEADLKLPPWSIITKLPFWYFLNLKSEISNLKSDNWFNSWKLPSGDHHLVIFYLPQYLEFIGFLLLPLPFLTSLIYLVFHKKSPV